MLTHLLTIYRMGNNIIRTITTISIIILTELEVIQ
jgi:hypothetical protein